MNERIQKRIDVLTQEHAQVTQEAQNAFKVWQAKSVQITQYETAIGELKALLGPEAEAEEAAEETAAE